MPKIPFKVLKQKSKRLYKSIKSLSCPAFAGEEIKFTSAGYHHLFYKPSGRRRPQSEIEPKLWLLPRAKELIKVSTTHKGIRTATDAQGKTFTYWALEGIIKGRNLRVIIRTKGSGNKHFWSIIPKW